MFCCGLNHVPPKSICCSLLPFGFEMSPWVNLCNAGSPVHGTTLNDVELLELEPGWQTYVPRVKPLEVTPTSASSLTLPLLLGLDHVSRPHPMLSLTLALPTASSHHDENHKPKPFLPRVVSVRLFIRHNGKVTYSRNPAVSEDGHIQRQYWNK